MANTYTALLQPFSDVTGDAFCYQGHFMHFIDSKDHEWQFKSNRNDLTNHK